MKTMIPNQLKFDLDLQDLPARATQVSSEALSLSAGGRVLWVDSGSTKEAIDDRLGYEGSAYSYCNVVCTTANGKCFVNSGNGKCLYSIDKHKNNTLECACVY